MQSMTGYGKAEYNKDGLSLLIEIRSVNNRFLDIVPKYPRIFLKYDDIIRKTISAKVARGRLELFINFKDTREGVKTYVVDTGLAKGYFDAYISLKQQFPDITDDFAISNLMKLPDVVTQGNECDDSIYQEVLISVLNEALDNLNSMRKAEGNKLEKDLLQRASNCESFVDFIAERAPLISDEYRQKLTERITEVMQGLKPDETRLMQEVALFADKSNIDEEITRLRSHISQFRTIAADDTPGRKLDFLIQEFNREANTICSKSNDVMITDCALKLKSEIEKIREQIQNIE